MLKTNHMPDSPKLRNSLANALSTYRDDEGVYVTVPASSSFGLHIKLVSRDGALPALLMSSCRYKTGTYVYETVPRESMLGWVCSVSRHHGGEDEPVPELTVVRRRLGSALRATVRHVIWRELLLGEKVLWVLLLPRQSIGTLNVVRSLFMGS